MFALVNCRTGEPKLLLQYKTVFQQVRLQREAPIDEAMLPRIMSQVIATPFDLTTGPMVRVTAIPLTQWQEHVLVISMHYAVTDGWSLSVFMKDISQAYNTLKHSKGECFFSPRINFVCTCTKAMCKGL